MVNFMDILRPPLGWSSAALPRPQLGILVTNHGGHVESPGYNDKPQLGMVYHWVRHMKNSLTISFTDSEQVNH